MREHVVLSVVDPLLAASLQPEHGGDQEKDLTLMVECRICQEDDTIQNLDIPCGCNGTLKVFYINFPEFANEDSKHYN